MFSVWLCIRKGSGFLLRWKGGVFLTGSRHAFVTYASDHRTALQSLLFLLLLPFQHSRDCMKKRELILALRWASIQFSSKFFYFTMNDSLSRLHTISKIENRENIVTFEEMLIHEPIEGSFLWPLPALRQESKNQKENRTTAGKYFYSKWFERGGNIINIMAKLTNQFMQTGLRTFDWQPLFTLLRWLPLRLSKRQSPLPTTVLLRTTLTRTINLHYYKIFIQGVF